MGVAGAILGTIRRLPGHETPQEAAWKATQAPPAATAANYPSRVLHAVGRPTGPGRGGGGHGGHPPAVGNVRHPTPGSQWLPSHDTGQRPKQDPPFGGAVADATAEGR